MQEEINHSYQDLIDEANEKHRQSVSRLWKLAETIKTDTSLEAAQRRELIKQSFSRLSMKDVKYTILNDVVTHDLGVSFRSNISHWRHLKNHLKKVGYDIAPGANDKLKDRAFGASLNVPVPQSYVVGAYLYDIPLHPNTVVKPLVGHSSRGVFYVKDPQHIRSFRSGAVYTSLREAATELDNSKLVNQKVWLSEQAIVDENSNPANDFKVYMFYGIPGLVQEIQRGRSEDRALEYCHYDPEGNRIRFGGGRKPFEGTGFGAQLLEYAQKVSKATPAPFIRVDFHGGGDSYYLGEITAHPGGTAAGEIHEDIDKRLGKMFIEAEARLYSDLLGGKNFDGYFKVYGSK